MFESFLSHTLSLGDLLADGRRFVVPSFQRPFSWQIREASRLLEDVQEAALGDLEHRTALYFLGPIVLLDPNWEPAPDSAVNQPLPGDRALHVVDGQQRLATLCLLLCALRDRLADHGDTAAVGELNRRLRADGPTDGVAAPDDREGVSDRAASGDASGPRLVLRARDQHWFVQNVGAGLPADDDLEVTSEAVARMAEIRQLFVEELVDTPIDDLRTLATYLLANCCLVVITTNELEYGYRIYLTFNHRGLELSRAQMIRAQLLKEGERGTAPDVKAFWDGAEQAMGELEFDGLFRIIQAIHVPSRTRIVKDIGSLAERSGGVEPFTWTILQPTAAALQRVKRARDPAALEDPEIRARLVYLSWLTHRDWMPSVVAYLVQHNDDLDRLRWFLSRLDRMALALMVKGTNKPSRAARFNAVLRAIRAGADDESVAQATELDKRDRDALNSSLRRDLNSTNATVKRFLLMRLEDGRRGTVTPELDPELTVEHIMPRRAPNRSEWRAMVPDGDERQALSVSLGNTTLVFRRHNQAARNRSFAEKQSVFFPDGQPYALSLTDELRGLASWEPHMIMAREARLIEELNAMFDFGLPE
ncbi:MAG: DUF262 domain-containing HNH endonuclease family protein [Pseudomonadota bacterium]